MRTRIGRIGTLTAAAMMVGAGLAAAPAAAAGPTLSAECHASLPSGPPTKSGGMLSGAGRGSCTVTGDPGSPWDLVVTVRLQVRVDGTWRTRASAQARLENRVATKRFPWVITGYACSGSALRSWRIRVTTQANLNEKSVFTMDTATATSSVVSRRC